MQFSPYLFWDTDPSTIDWDKHARYVMTRVLCRGTIDDFKNLLNYTVVSASAGRSCRPGTSIKEP